MKEIFLELLDTFRRLGRNPFGLRNILFYTSTLVAVIAYFYIANKYMLATDVFEFRLKPKTYKFYSGSPGGFYTHIGTTLEEQTRDNRSIKIINVPSAGGAENAINVMTTSNSFGLVQEESVAKDDFMRTEIHYIAPLYMSRLHILYNIESYNNLVSENADSIPRISAVLNNSTATFFARAKINTGPVGSTTRIIASYLMTEINKQINDRNLSLNQQMNYYPLWAFDYLENGEIDIMCSTAGAPLRDTERLLSSGKFGLMSIDPSMVAIITRKYGAGVRLADFKNKYVNTANTSTIGSYAFLVASKDVPNSDILELLKVLNKSKGLIKEKVGAKESDDFQLDEFDFLNSFQAEHDKTFFHHLKDYFIFFLSIIVATAVVLSILLWVVSSNKQNRHFLRISKIAKDSIPGNTELIDQEGDETAKHQFPIPKVPDNLNEIITAIIEGLKKLYELRVYINSDYRTGGITEKHHIYLLEHANRVKIKLQHILAQQFNEAFRKEGPINIEKFRAFYTQGYLIKDDYYTLKDRFYAE